MKSSFEKDVGEMRACTLCGRERKLGVTLGGSHRLKQDWTICGGGGVRLDNLQQGSGSIFKTNPSK